MATVPAPGSEACGRMCGRVCHTSAEAAVTEAQNFHPRNAIELKRKKKPSADEAVELGK